MCKMSFFSVLRSNIKCAICRNKNCKLRFTPNRREVQIYGGRRYVDTCPKDRDKQWKEMLERKLP